MQSSAQDYFTCQACGYQFPGSRDQLAHQPTCPKCHTFGRILTPDGVTLSGNRPGAKPAAGRGGPPAPRRRPRPGRSAQPAPYAVGGDYDDDGPVEISADIAYGRKKSPRAMINMIILMVLAVGMIATVGFIVNTFKSDRIEVAKKKKEVVLDLKDYERAINESVDRVRDVLQRDESMQFRETGNLKEVVDIIAQSDGGAPPGWSTPPKPGSPFKSYSFTLHWKDEKNDVQHAGFLVLLYYKTGTEVIRAGKELEGKCTTSSHYGLKVSPDIWFAAYSGVNFSGKLRDAIRAGMTRAEPSSFHQFQRRMGAELDPSLMD